MKLSPERAASAFKPLVNLDAGVPGHEKALHMPSSLVRLAGLPAPSREVDHRQARNMGLAAGRRRGMVDSRSWLEGVITMAHFYSWFPGDYQRDTTHLSFIEDAAYRRLLDAYYMRGVIEANASGLLRVARAISPDEQAAVIKVAAEFFEERDGRLHHAKVEHEMARSLAVSAARSEAGKIGVAAKRAKRAKLAAIAEANALTNAEANASDLLSKTQANRKQPIPTVYTEGKPSVTAAPSSPDPKKAIFDLGVSILTKTGTTEGGARSFLAKYAKQDEGKLAEVLGHLAANAKVEPKAYIAAAFKPEARGLVI